MLRLSSERVVDEVRENQRAVSYLIDFHYTEDGRDRGAGSTSLPLSSPSLCSQPCGVHCSS
jgi:hypothetical protein